MEEHCCFRNCYCVIKQCHSYFSFAQVQVWQRLEKNVFLSKITFVFMMVTTIISMAVLSGLKYFAVLAPFTHKRVVSLQIVKKFTAPIWLVITVLMSLVTHFSIIYFSSFTKTPRYNLSKPGSEMVKNFTRTILCIYLIVMLGTSLGFLIANI